MMHNATRKRRNLANIFLVTLAACSLLLGGSFIMAADATVGEQIDLNRIQVWDALVKLATAVVAGMGLAITGLFGILIAQIRRQNAIEVKLVAVLEMIAATILRCPGGEIIAAQIRSAMKVKEGEDTK